MKDFSQLLQELPDDILLRTLSVNPKKWANMILELSELCSNSNSREAISHLIEECAMIVKLEPWSRKSVDLFDEADTKRISNFISQQDVRKPVLMEDKNVPAKPNPKLFQKLLMKISQKENDGILLTNLQAISYVNSKLAKAAKNKSSYNKNRSLIPPENPLDIGTEFLAFLNFYMNESNNLHTGLILIKLLLYFREINEISTISSLLSTSSSSSSIQQTLISLSQSNILDGDDLGKINEEEKRLDHLKTFEVVCRMILCCGQPAKLSNYEVQGKALGMIGGISIRPDMNGSNTVYFESTISGKQLAGVRVGWGICGADLSQPTELPGNTDECWTYEVYSEQFFHDTLHVLDERNTAAKLLTESKVESTLADSKEIDSTTAKTEHDSSITSNVLVEPNDDEQIIRVIKLINDQSVENLKDIDKTGEVLDWSGDALATGIRGTLTGFEPSLFDSEVEIKLKSFLSLVHLHYSAADESEKSNTAFFKSSMSSSEITLSDVENFLANGEISNDSLLHKSISNAIATKNADELSQRTFLREVLVKKLLDAKNKTPDNTTPEPEGREQRIKNGYQIGGVPLQNSPPKVAPWTSGSILGCLLHLGSGEMHFFINGAFVGKAPVTIPMESIKVINRGLTPVFCCNSSSVIDINIGQGPYVYRPFLPQNNNTESTTQNRAKTPTKTTDKLIKHDKTSPKSDVMSKGSAESEPTTSILSGYVILHSKHRIHPFISFDRPVTTEILLDTASSVDSTSAAIETGVGIFVDNLTSESFKSMTFEVSCRLTEQLPKIDESNTIDSPLPSVDLSQQQHYTLFNCSPTTNPLEEMGCTIGVDFNGAVFLDVNECERVSTKPNLIETMKWHHIVVIYVYHRSSSKSNVSILVDGLVVLSQFEILGNRKNKVTKLSPRKLCIGGTALSQHVNKTRFVGDICEAVLWSTAKSIDKNLVSRGRSKITGVEVDLLLYFGFEQPFVSNFTDQAIIKNNVRNSESIKILSGFSWHSFDLKSNPNIYAEAFQNVSNVTGYSKGILEFLDDAFGDLNSKSGGNFPSDSDVCLVHWFLGSSIRKLVVSTEKFKLSANDSDSLQFSPPDLSVRKFHYSRNEINSIIEPTEVNFLLLNSLIRELLSVFRSVKPVKKDSNSEESLDHIVLYHLLYVLLNVLEVNFTSIEERKFFVTPTPADAYFAIPDKNKSELCSKLLTTLFQCLSLFSDDSITHNNSSSALRYFATLLDKTLSVIIAGFNILIPQGSNRLFMLECLLVKQNQSNFRLVSASPVVPIYQEILSSLVKQNEVSEIDNKTIFYDPIGALLVIPTKTANLLFSMIVNFLHHPNNVMNLVPDNVWPVVDDPALAGTFSGTSAYTIKSNHKIITDLSNYSTPKPGDIVKRGPDWKYNNQDGGVGSVGMVVEVSSWLNEQNKCIGVLWRNGNYNTYRWGVVADNHDNASPNSNGLLYDLSVYGVVQALESPLPVANQTAPDGKWIKGGTSSSVPTSNVSTKIIDKPNANNKSEGNSYQRKQLSFTPEEVSKAMLEDKGNQTSLSKRTILIYMKENSPIDWQEKMKIARSANSILSKMNNTEICSIYSEFFKTFSLASVAESTQNFSNKSTAVTVILPFEPKMRLNWNDELQTERFVNILNLLLAELELEDFNKSSSSSVTTSESSLSLLVAMQSVMLGLFGSSKEDMKSFLKLVVLRGDSLLDKSTFSAKDKQYHWNWLRGIWEETVSPIETVNTKPVELIATPPNTDPSIIGGAKILTELSIEKHFIGANLQVKNRSRAIEIFQTGDREWSTCICSSPLKPNTGVYKWYARIKSFSERRGHCMIGVAKGEFSCDEFLGQDQESWGLSPMLDLFHGGRKKKTETDKKLMAGSVIEMTLDTNKGTLHYIEIGPDPSSQFGPIGFDNLKGMTVFPAFSLYSPGDCISIQTNLEDIIAMTKYNRASSNSSVTTPTPKPSFLFGGYSNYGSTSTATQKLAKAPNVNKTKYNLLGSPQPIVINYCLHLLATGSTILSDSNISRYGDRIITVCLMQVISNLCKWEFVAKYKCKLLHDSLNNFVDKIKLAVKNIRSNQVVPQVISRSITNETDNGSADSDHSRTEGLLLQLSVLIASYISKITKSWIRGEHLEVDNHRIAQEILNYGVLASPSIDFFKFDPVTGEPLDAEVRKNSPSNWLSNPLFRNGYRSRDGGDLNDGFHRLVYDRSEGIDSFIQWISMHDLTHKNYRRFGGDEMNPAVRLLFCVNCYHNGFLNLLSHLVNRFCNSFLPNSPKDEDLQLLKPPPFVIVCWEAAMKLRSWAKKLSEQGISYEFISNRVSSRAIFLLELEPSNPEWQFDKSEMDFKSWITSFPTEFPAIQSLRSTISEYLSYTEIFVTDSFSLVHLRSALNCVQHKAEKRRDGFKGIRSALENFSQDIGNGAKVALLSELSLSCKGIDVVYNSKLPNMVRNLQKYEDDSMGHYLCDMNGIAKSQAFEIQGAYDSLYAVLTEELSMTSLSDDKFYQLTLLDCLGVRILEQDHTMLSRVKFFYAIQELLDSSLSNFQSDSITTTLVATADTPKHQLYFNKLVVKATMKLFILMALQVATTKDTDVDGEELSGAHKYQQKQFLAPVLRKIKSGPATLSNAVFDILYNQLNDITDNIHTASKQSKPSNYFIPTINISTNSSLVVSEAITLLLCVSKNSICQRILCRPSWILLLLKTAILNPFECQQKAILLLADLLAIISPSDIDETHGDLQAWISNYFDSLHTVITDANSNSFFNVGKCTASKSVIQIVLHLISRHLINDGTYPIVCTEGTDIVRELKEHSLPILAEAVTLIRLLYLHPSWGEIVQSTIIDIFSFASTNLTSSTLVDKPHYSAYLISTFCILGGQIDIPFIGSPVIFQSNSREYHLGVFSDYHDSIDKIVVSSLSSSNINVPSVQAVSLNQIYPASRCPKEKLNFSTSVINEIIRFMMNFIFPIPGIVSPPTIVEGLIPDDKTESTLLDDKKAADIDASDKVTENNSSTAGFSVTSNISQLLITTCYRVFSIIVDQSCRSSTNNLEISLQNLGDQKSKYLFNILNEAQKVNRSGGLLDLPIFEEYVMILMRLRQKLWISASQSSYKDQQAKSDAKTIPDAKKEESKDTLPTDNVQAESKAEPATEFAVEHSNTLEKADFKSAIEQIIKATNDGSSTDSKSPVVDSEDASNLFEKFLAYQLESENPIPGHSDWNLSEEYAPLDENTGSSNLIDSLSEMGFSRRWCEFALDVSGWDQMEALNYILQNSHQLDEMIEAVENNRKMAETDIVNRLNQTNQPLAGSKNNDQLSNQIDSSGNEWLSQAPSFDSERLGCIYPGDDLQVVEGQNDSQLVGNMWYKIPYSDVDDGNYGDMLPDLSEMYVWVPKIYLGKTVILDGGCEGGTESLLSNSPIDELVVDKNYRVIGLSGALVRSGADIASSEIRTINTGEVVHAVLEKFNSEGTLRLRIDKPVEGWISKIIGLVSLVDIEGKNLMKKEDSVKISDSFLSGSTATITSEFEQLEKIEDHMENLTSNDAFNKDDRFFGSMQGNQFIKFKDKEKSFIQSNFNRRMRVSGCTSYVNYLQASSSATSGSSLPVIDALIADTLMIMNILYARKSILSLIFKTSNFNTNLTSKNIQSTSKSQLSTTFNLDTICPSIVSLLLCSDLVADFSFSRVIEVSDISQKLFNLMRLSVFRGEPYTFTGLEAIPFNNVVWFGVPDDSISVEQLFDRIIFSLLTFATVDEYCKEFQKKLMMFIIESLAKNLRLSCAIKYADHFWADSSYEDDLDNDVHEQPNLHYAVWITRILMQLNQFDVTKNVFRCWSLCLRGTSLSLKHFVLNSLSDLLLSIRERVENHVDENNQRQLLSDCIQMLPVERINMLGSKRLWYEMEDNPAYSRFLQSLLHFISEIDISGSFIKSLDTENKNATKSSISLPSQLLLRQPSTSGLEFDNMNRFNFIQRSFLHLVGNSSCVNLSPPKDLTAAWTVEFWIRRSAPVIIKPEVVESQSEDKMNPSPEILDSKNAQDEQDKATNSEAVIAPTQPEEPSEKGIGLSGLLNIILGSGGNKGASESAPGTPNNTVPKETAPIENNLPSPSPVPVISEIKVQPLYLLQSSKGFIKIQAGGRLFNVDEKFDDPLQSSDPIDDEAMCVSIGQNVSGGERIFDCVVPSNRWIHIAITSQNANSTTSIYIDGDLKDTISYSMPLPLALIGANDSNSFQGDLAEFRVWSYARCPHEIVRDMNTDVSVYSSKHLISLFKFCEGNGRLSYDKCGLFSPCKLQNIHWKTDLAPKPKVPNLPIFMITDTEEAEGFFGEEIGSSAKVAEMTGVIKINSVFGVYGALAVNITEIICLCYRLVDLSNDEKFGKIEGYLNWTERSVRTKIGGEISKDGDITFSLPQEEIFVLGSPDGLDWLKGMEFTGKIIDGIISGDLLLQCYVPSLLPLSPGLSRVDKLLLDKEMTYSVISKSSLLLNSDAKDTCEQVSLKSTAKEGQYVVSFEICPYFQSINVINEIVDSKKTTSDSIGEGSKDECEILSEGDLLIPATLNSVADLETNSSDYDTPYGIHGGQGFLWLQWKINANCGSIGFGLCTYDALVHPDSCVDANDGTWTYSVSGTATHGSNLFLCDAAEENDWIDIQIDANNGILTIFRNNAFVIDFRGLLEHPNMVKDQAVDVAYLGVRPFVNLVAGGDSVTFIGNRTGAVELTFNEEKVEDCKVAFKGSISEGSLSGYGIMTYSNNSVLSHIFGMWKNNSQTGHHLIISDSVYTAFLAAENTVPLSFAFVRQYQNGIIISDQDISDPSIANSIENLKLECNKFLTSYKKVEPKESAEEVPANTSIESVEKPAVTPVAKSTGNTKTKFVVKVKDSSKVEYQFKVSNTMPLKKLFQTYAAKKGHNSQTYVFKSGDIVLSGDNTFEFYGMIANAVLDVTVRSLIKATEAEVEKFIDNSSAPYVVRIIYESGATVRNGIEIEESDSIRTLAHDEVIECFKKSYTFEGIGRYQIADGWISEKLRGGSEAKVTQILCEKLVTPLMYKVVREEGAKVRRGYSLTSEDEGFCPGNTLVTVAEKRMIKNESELTTRVRIVLPEQWKGWASEKEHILQVVGPSESPESAIQSSTASSTSKANPVDAAISLELERRSKLRVQRASKSTVLKQKLYLNQKCRRLLRVKGSLSVSEETFFLLRKSKTGNGPTISSDFETVTSEDSSSGRSMVLGSRGFSRGIHYWEVLVKQANWGSVFIGVAPEDAAGWSGYGLLNYRATQAYGSETLYGSYFSANDKVGVLLDMDHGAISFFKDGEDFNLGKVRVINMGVAYHNLRRGIGRSSITTLFPCFGVKSPGDSLSISKSHWISYRGLSPNSLLARVLQAKSFIYRWNYSYRHNVSLPNDLVANIYEGYKKWRNSEQITIKSRPGIEVVIETSQSALINAVGSQLVEMFNLKVGKIIRTQYGPGRILGARKNQLWYSYESGENNAWYWKGKEQLEELINFGFIGLNEEDSDQANVEDNNQIITISKENNLEFNEFNDRLNSNKWIMSDDEKICDVINCISFKYDLDPLRVSVADINKYIISAASLPDKNTLDIQARYVALCALNKAVATILPLVDFNNGDNRTGIIHTNINIFNYQSYSPVPSLLSSGSNIIEIKNSIFTRTKLAFWNKAIKETTTPTGAPPDEYERPDDLREININRVEAKSVVKIKSNIIFSDRLRVSVFGQLMDSMISWDERALRRAFIHMQDAGQARAFFVKFTGEGVDDQGGPYRAVYQTAVGEETHQLLELLIPCANAASDIAENRDKFVLNSSIINNPSGPSVFTHLGKLIGLACRHNILVSLSLPKTIWKPLVKEILTSSDLRAVDTTIAKWIQDFQIPRHLMTINEQVQPDEEIMEEFENIVDLFVQALTTAANGYGNSNPVTPSHPSSNVKINKLSNKAARAIAIDAITGGEESLRVVMQLICHLHLQSQSEGLKMIYKGLSAVLPVELFPLFNAEELETVFCGTAEVDIETLKKATVYEGVNPTDSHITYFWSALDQLDRDDKAAFVNFCSGRSRLPSSAADYQMSFKLTSPPPHSEKHPDNYLPIARTCFFTLSLPKYSSIELKYAINNTELMDADFIDRRGTSGWDNVRS
eukprot:gene5374-7452_t